MNWLPNAEVGDVFRWVGDRSLCRITRINDNGIRIEFVRITGKDKGAWGYTLLPQDVVLVSAVERLGDLA